jgi:hypothetical protein
MPLSMRTFSHVLRLSQLKQSSKSRFTPNSPAPIRLTPSTPPPNHVKPVCPMEIALFCLTHHPALGTSFGHRPVAERPDFTEYLIAVLGYRDGVPIHRNNSHRASGRGTACEFSHCGAAASDARLVGGRSITVSDAHPRSSLRNARLAIQQRSWNVSGSPNR